MLNHNTGYMNGSLIVFKQFIQEQTSTSLSEKFTKLSIQNSHQFQFPNGILTLSDSCVKWRPLIQPGFTSESIWESIKFYSIPEYEVFVALFHTIHRYIQQVNR
jgi:hypothetical protein